MRVEDVVDWESLKAFLNALPDDERETVSKRVAFRCAARALPKPVDYFAQTDPAKGSINVPLIILSWALVTSVAATLNAPPISSCHPISTPFDDTRHANEASDAISAQIAAFEAAEANKNYMDSVLRSVGMANNSLGEQRSDGWRAVRQDISDHLKGKNINEKPLWPLSLQAGRRKSLPFNPFLSLSGVRLGGNFNADFWQHWYQRIVEGRDIFPLKIAAVLVGLKHEDWQKGPGHINPMFDEVLALYRADEFQLTHSYGFRARLDRKKDKLDIEAVDPVDLAEIVKAMRSALSDFSRRSNRGTSHNQLNALCYDTLEPEIADFRKVLSKHKNDPQALHDQILRYEKHFIRVLKDRELPQAAEVASLIDDMRAAQTGICLISEPVREKEMLRTAIEVEKATEAQKLQAIRNCLGMLTDGTGEMELFAALSVKALVDPDASEAEKQMAWQFAYRMGANAVTTIKRYEEEVGSDKTDLGKRMKEFSDMAVAGDKFVDVVQEAYAEGKPWVEGFLQTIADTGFPGIVS